MQDLIKHQNGTEGSPRWGEKTCPLEKSQNVHVWGYFILIGSQVCMFKILKYSS